ncbi:DUF6177 family protein [Streptomyces huasconensis]|nr:DUF6177 family protein [Streptomyces huasconensis]
MNEIGRDHALHPQTGARPTQLGPVARPALHYPLGDGTDPGPWATLQQLSRHLKRTQEGAWRTVRGADPVGGEAAASGAEAHDGRVLTLDSSDNPPPPRGPDGQTSRAIRRVLCRGPSQTSRRRPPICAPPRTPRP